MPNNVAELCGMVEAMFYILGALEDQRGVKRRRRDICIQARDAVCIHPDSKYAMGIVEGLFLPRENVLLGYLLRQLTHRVRQRVRLCFEWSRGHSTDEGNTMADSLAAIGMDATQVDTHMKENGYRSTTGARRSFENGWTTSEPPSRSGRPFWARRCGSGSGATLPR